MSADHANHLQGQGLPSSAVVRLTSDGAAIIVATNDGARLPLGMHIDLHAEGVSTVELASGDGDGQLQIVHFSEAPPVAIDSIKPLALVIDDERSNRAYYEAVFEQMGWSVVTARDGYSGIDAFDRTEPVMAVVDVRLPDLNGYQVVRQLRVLGRRPSMIVLMSSDPAMVDPVRASTAGADVALVAPLGISQLRTLLERAMPRADLIEVSAVGRPSRFLLAFNGSARVYDGARWIEIPVGMSRTALAVLAAVHPAPVSAEILLTALETPTDGEENDDAPPGYHPDQDESALQGLFGWLASQGIPDLIAASASGYRLNVSADQIDTLTFEQSAAQLTAADLPPARFVAVARGLIDEAHLEPYAGVSSPLVDAARARMREARATLEESLAVRLVMLDSTAEALLLLRRLTSLEPWREGAWALLLIALYRQGRQGEALELYEHIRTVLIKLMGVDPCPALRNVYKMILSQDERLVHPDFLTGDFRTQR